MSTLAQKDPREGTIAAFLRVSRGAALQRVPNLAWVSFATARKPAIVWLL